MTEDANVARWLHSMAERIVQDASSTAADVERAIMFANTAATLLRGDDTESVDELEKLLAQLRVKAAQGAESPLAENAVSTGSTQNAVADHLYDLCIELHKRTEQNDMQAARQLVEAAVAAINAYGGTNYERTVELKSFIACANDVLPPTSFKDLLDRLQRMMLSRLFPKQSTSRWIFYSLSVLCILIVGFFSFRDKLPALPVLWSHPIRVGAMDFEEQGIFGEIIAQYLERRNLPVIRVFGQSQAELEHGIENGAVDCYVEYTGAPYYLKFHQDKPAPAKEVYDFDKANYANVGVTLSDPFPFQNEWAIWVRSDDAENWNVSTVSELVTFSKARNLRAGWPPDFVHDPKGGAAEMMLQYGLMVHSRELDISEVYAALKHRIVDVIVGNSTDAEAL